MKKIYITLGLTLLLTIAFFSMAHADTPAMQPPANAGAATAAGDNEVKSLGRVGVIRDGKSIILDVVAVDDKTAQLKGPSPESNQFLLDAVAKSDKGEKALTIARGGTAAETINNATTQALIFVELTTQKSTKQESEKRTPKEKAQEKAHKLAMDNCTENDIYEKIKGDDRMQCFEEKIAEKQSILDDPSKTISGKERKEARDAIQAMLNDMISDESISGEKRVTYLKDKIGEYLDSSNANLKRRGQDLLALLQNKFTTDVINGNSEKSAFVKYFNDILKKQPDKNATFADGAIFNSALYAQANATYQRSLKLYEMIETTSKTADFMASNGNVVGARGALEQVRAMAAEYSTMTNGTITNLDSIKKALVPGVEGYAKEDLEKNYPDFQKMTDKAPKLKASAGSDVPTLLKNLNSTIQRFAGRNSPSSASGEFGFTVNNAGSGSAQIAGSNTASASVAHYGCAEGNTAVGNSTNFDTNMARLAGRGTCGKNIQLPYNPQSLLQGNMSNQPNISGLSGQQTALAGSTAGGVGRFGGINTANVNRGVNLGNNTPIVQ